LLRGLNDLLHVVDLAECLVECSHSMMLDLIIC
jgi:hypothetical protein